MVLCLSKWGTESSQSSIKGIIRRNRWVNEKSNRSIRHGWSKIKNQITCDEWVQKTGDELLTRPSRSSWEVITQNGWVLFIVHKEKQRKMDLNIQGKGRVKTVKTQRKNLQWIIQLIQWIYCWLWETESLIWPRD